MNIALLFRQIAAQLQSEFVQSGQSGHPLTAGAQREDALIKFLEKRIPCQYRLLKGEIVSSKTGWSKHFDLIIFDASKAPIWKDNGISIVPIEGVCGVIEVKSSLSKAELLDGLDKIKQLRFMSPRNYCQITGPGTVNSFLRPYPFGIIFGYRLSSNSLESLVSNLTEFEKTESRVNWPNAVVVLNEGVIHHLGFDNTGAQSLFATDRFFNKELIELRVVPIRFGDETLFEFTNILFELLNTTYIGEFNPAVYRRSPSKIGSHSVFGYKVRVTSEGIWLSLNEVAIDSIYDYSRTIKKYPLAEIINRMNGAEPEAVLASLRYEPFYLYNPEDLPGIHELPEYKSGGEDAVLKAGIRTLVPFFSLVIDGEDFVLPDAYINDSWLTPYLDID